MMMPYNAVFWFVCLLVILIVLEAIYPLDLDLSSMRIFGLLCLFASLLIAAWTKYLYTRHCTSYDPADAPLVLITNSIYALSRNPIYIALLLAFLGISLIFSLSFFLLGTFLLYLILSRYIIPHEEEELRRTFQQAYVEYESSTPKWI
jgi:protein-S-isoprenylcysteine O-methyltransferase Ste14